MASRIAVDGSGPANSLTDDVADEIAQRCHAAVVPIGREIARAAQARNPHRIEHVIVGLGIEEGAGRVEIAGTGRHARNEQLGVARAVDVAGAAADVGAPRDVAENGR